MADLKAALSAFATATAPPTDVTEFTPGAVSPKSTGEAQEASFPALSVGVPPVVESVTADSIAPAVEIDDILLPIMRFKDMNATEKAAAVNVFRDALESPRFPADALQFLLGHTGVPSTEVFSKRRPYYVCDEAWNMKYASVMEWKRVMATWAPEQVERRKDLVSMLKDQLTRRLQTAHDTYFVVEQGCAGTAFWSPKVNTAFYALLAALEEQEAETFEE